MSDNKKNYEVAIIGAGPAGIACAIQLKRYGINAVLFEKNEIGGLLRNANLVENYPGFSRGISGIELVKKFDEQMKVLGISPVFEEVQEIEHKEELFEIKTNNAFYKSKFLVISSGTKPKLLPLKIDEIAKQKVFYEICDLYKHEIKNKKVVITGSGDAAFDYAINLASNTEVKEVIILNRSSKTKCLDLLKERAFKITEIKYVEHEEIAELRDDSGLLSIRCKSGKVFKSDYLLVAIGREPNLEFLNLLKETKNNKRLFFIGDVKNDIFRQTAIAAGDGIKAAMEIYKHLC